MKIEDKIYKLGLNVLDELLLHRNSTKTTEVSIEDASTLSHMIVHVNPHNIFTFSEEEIIKFYQNIWRKEGKNEKNKNTNKL